MKVTLIKILLLIILISGCETKVKQEPKFKTHLKLTKADS